MIRIVYQSLRQWRSVEVLVTARLTSAAGTGSTADAPGEVTEPPLPQYKPREGETVQEKRARLVYQSRKRGMLENGLLLSTFVSKHLKSLDETQLDLYDRIINKPSNDWDIYHWMIGKSPTPDEYNNEVMKMLQRHAGNEEREVRLQQPDLHQDS